MMGRTGQGTWLTKLWPALIVSICFCLGGLLGVLFASFASEDSVLQIRWYLSDYLHLAGEKQVSWTVPAVLWNHGRWMLGCIVFGLTGLGTAMLPILFGARGFVLAFAMSCFFRIYGGAGLIPALLLFLFPALFWAPGFFLTGSWGLRESVRLIQNRLPGCSVSPRGSGVFRSHIMLGFLLLVLCIVFECGLLPVLLPSAARILG